MVTLLAESKTMSSVQSEIAKTTFNLYQPSLEETADKLMSYIASLNPSEIAQILGISPQLAVKTRNLAYDFPHKQTGYSAINGYIGEAFRALDVKTLSETALASADNNLRIISSIYGILKPSDIIKPYRCEFNKDVTPDHKTSIQLFKSKVTVQLVNFIKARKIKDIIDLLPGDADKCLDWKIVRAFSSVHKIVFKEVQPFGELKTPSAKRLKELRGLMTRAILDQSIQSFDDLKMIKSNHFLFSSKDSKPGLPVFITS